MHICFRWKLLSFLFIIFFFLSACNKNNTPDLSKTILSLKETGQLVTAQYTLSKVIRASDDKTWYKIGERKIIIQCEAELKAGINLQNITGNNFEITGDSIAVNLPHAQLFSLSIPPNRIQVAYQDIGVLRNAFSAVEREQLVAQAEPQMRQLVASLGILSTAENNAAVFIKSLFKQAGYKKISITYS